MSSNYHSDQQYKDSINTHLSDSQLRENLKSCMDTLKGNRKRLVSTRYKDWEALRELGRQIKERALKNLPELLERFESNAKRNGINVHWAKDSNEANEIILELAKSRNVDTILKGKSMASEEIHLNAFMKQRGINAVETDLGELIIQLIDEPPVHIVAPAIHKNRNQIGKIFEQNLKVKFTNVPEELNGIARVHLRGEFKKFKMGLTGVNFAIANEGAIWLLENEGNGRMSSSAPDIHVAICGIEKIVENFEDAAVLDTLLVPSATGAPITCYNNIISSPRKEGELDGPKEIHIIMLDNNRSNMLSQPHYHKALSCIRCGTCLNHCPVYDKIGGHSYLVTYPGPIGEVISPQIFGLDNCGYMTNLCSLCGRCSEKCPVKIPLAEIIRDLRSERVGQGIKKIKGYENVERDEVEQKMMRDFSDVATKGWKWRFTLKMLHFLTPMLAFILQRKFMKNNLAAKWLINHDMPILSGNLHSKVKKLKGVVYE